MFDLKLEVWDGEKNVCVAKYQTLCHKDRIFNNTVEGVVFASRDLHGGYPDVQFVASEPPTPEKKGYIHFQINFWKEEDRYTDDKVFELLEDLKTGYRNSARVKGAFFEWGGKAIN